MHVVGGGGGGGGVCLFWVARAIFQLSRDCHHYRWQGCKFRPMLSTYGFYQWGFFYVPHLLRHGTSDLKIISERPVIPTSECRALGEEAITTYLKRLRFDAAGTRGARTHDLPDAKRECYHIWLPQPVSQPILLGTDVRLRFSKQLPFIFNIFENHTHSYISVENPDPDIYFITM
jgi:hypothetical protein